MNKFNPFNLGADNFSAECLMDLSRFNFFTRFLAHHQKWEPHVDEQRKKYLEICEKLLSFRKELNFDAAYPEFSNQVSLL
jgi:hypothetical protein